MKLVATIALAISLAACDPEASIGPRHGEQVRAQEEALLAALSAEDAAAAAALYAPDAQMLNPFAEPLTTPAEIQAGFQAMFDDPNGSLTFTNTDMILPSAGDYAVTQGAFTVSYSDTQSQARVESSGSYITLWRHQDDDSWKIIRDIATPGPTPTSASQ